MATHFSNHRPRRTSYKVFMLVPVGLATLAAAVYLKNQPQMQPAKAAQEVSLSPEILADAAKRLCAPNDGQPRRLANGAVGQLGADGTTLIYDSRQTNYALNCG